MVMPSPAASLGVSTLRSAPQLDATTGKRPSFEMSADARLLYQRLRKTTVGDVVTYKELSEVVSRKVVGGFGPLNSARKACQREHSIIFESVMGVGLKHMSDEDKVRSTDSMASRLRKAARRGIGRLASVHNYGNLTRETQDKHNAALSVFSVVGSVTTNAAMKKVEEAVSAARKELPMAETLKALGLS